MFDNLPKPFKPVMTIQDPNGGKGWYFGFEDAVGKTYLWQGAPCLTEKMAEKRMHKFCEHGGDSFNVLPN